jgi:hypothetical protein
VQKYALIRLKDATGWARVGIRFIRHHSQFGNLHAVPLRAALRLIDDGHAKLLPHQSLLILRAEVAALERRAAA